MVNHTNAAADTTNHDLRMYLIRVRLARLIDRINKDRDAYLASVRAS